MGAVLLLAVTLGLCAYGLLLSHRRFSPRATLVERMRPLPVTRPRSNRSGRTQWILPAGGALLGSLPWLLFGRTPDMWAMVLYPPLFWLAPLAWGWLQQRRRRALLERSYPDLLAHLATQTRAGASTLQAFATAPPVLRGPLRDEVEELLADLRIAPFPAALQRFADRCRSPEIRAFTAHVIYQQSLGISLPEVLASEEAHALAMARQTMRQRIQRSAITMAAVTVILLVNGLLIYMLPLFYDLSRLTALR